MLIKIQYYEKKRLNTVELARIAISCFEEVSKKLLKHRIVLTLIYSAGLRGQEVINLKLSDIDFERMSIYIRQSKYKKDRLVPLEPSATTLNIPAKNTSQIP